jgi:hypothetical protein
VKFLLLVSFCLIPFLLYCDIMYVHLADGTTAEFQVQEIQQITFNNVSNNDWVAFLPKVPIKFLTNYPNPFNPSTIIKFELTEPNQAEVSIYNIKGQLVKVLVKEQMAKGVHELTWNGLNEAGDKCASGPYIYQVKCNDQIKVNKMTILK